MFDKRQTLKLLGTSFISLLFLPYKYLYSAAKKIINPELTNEQKDIMFNEGTERPFTSKLLNEKRAGFYHCANCGAKLFASNAKFDSGTGWPSFTEALPGAFKTKIDFSFGMKELNIIVRIVEFIMDMFSTTDLLLPEKDFVTMVYV